MDQDQMKFYYQWLKDNNLTDTVENWDKCWEEDKKICEPFMPKKIA